MTAARTFQDQSPDLPGEHPDLSGGQRQDQRASEGCAAFSFGPVAQSVQDEGDAFAVADVPAEACGADARSAVQCVDLDAGVVAERRDARLHLREARLDQRVLVVAQAHFGRELAQAEVIGAEQPDPRQCLAESSQFAGVLGRQQQFEAIHVRTLPIWGRMRSSSAATAVTPVPTSETYVSAGIGAASP